MASMKHTKMLLTLCTMIATCRSQYTPVVRVRSGELRGVIARDGFFGHYNSYLGVPYAKVKDRFQAATSVKWDGVLKANNDDVRCTQRSWIPSYLTQGRTVVFGQEDCLTLNVYTSANNVDQSKRLSSLKPVIVFIHGGGFRDGSSSSRIYGPQYLLRHGVIVVSINYRLEVLGFLCLGIKEAPGNVGLKDQVAALKWVKDNIDQFGGDPENITIFGESAGSASVMYHLLSPMSQGLFQRAIMESGSAVSPWAFQFEPIKVASQLAKQMGYKTEDPYELYKIFVNKSAKELLSTRVPRAKGDIVQSENIFVPCAEKGLPNIETFLNSTPYDKISNKQYAKVPMIIGYNDAEGYFFVGKENDSTIENMNFRSSLPRDLKFPTEGEAQKTADKLKELYMRNKKVSRKTLMELVRYEGDSGIIYPVTATADMITQTNDKDTFIYKFAYDGILNLIKIESGFGTAPGASHADELFYIFKPALTDIAGLIESDIINKMTTMWTNFAKFGNPTPEQSSELPRWLPASKENPSLLVINRQFSTSPLWESDKLGFWNETYAMYRRNK